MWCDGKREADEARTWVSEKLEVMENCSTEHQRACQKVGGSDDKVTQKNGAGSQRWAISGDKNWNKKE